MLTNIAMLIGVAVGIYALVWFIRNQRPVFRSFGITASRRTPLDILVGVVVPFAAISLVFLTEWALGAITVTDGADDWSTAGGLLATMVFVVIIEELVFRVLLLTGLVIMLRNVTGGRWIAVAVVSLFFGAVHLTNPNATLIGAFGTALGGVIYAVAFLGTRAIWLPIFLHLSWNVSQAFWGFPVSGGAWPGAVTSTSAGNELLNGGGYGPEAGIPGMLARVLIITLVFVYLTLVWRDGSIARLEYAPDPVKVRTAATA